MRIALVHSFYRSDVPSGENTVVGRQASALAEAGHAVRLVARYTDSEMLQRGYPVRSALTVATGIGPDPTDELTAFQPDVVHVHNLFPNFGERWLARWQGPLIATVHNFRSICANGLLYRDGRVCTLCSGGNSWHALLHGCYRDSRAATLPLALHNAGGAKRNQLLNRADQIITLSERSRKALVDANPSLAGKLVVIPNGLPDRFRPEPAPRTHWAVVGRLSDEKGIAELLGEWPEGEPLVVVGDGPQRGELEAFAHPDVTFAGVLAQVGVDDLLRRAWGLVFPSRWYEGFPTVIAEALMHGTPVVAKRGNGGADFIAQTGAGRVYDDDLRVALDEVRGAGPAVSGLARSTYVDLLTVESWTSALESTYRDPSP